VCLVGSKLHVHAKPEKLGQSQDTTGIYIPHIKVKNNPMELSPCKTMIHSNGQGNTHLLQNLNYQCCILKNRFTVIFNMYLALPIGFLIKNGPRIA